MIGFFVLSPFVVAIAIAGLVLLAAFTKSAQVPFHFWLPNAMEAPTPVSAYLHSATMVKAGVYLIARMTPIIGSTPVWTTAVTVAGAATMIVGAYRAVQETDLKRILAYSTVSALGVLTMLLGVGTRDAIVAALTYDALLHARGWFPWLLALIVLASVFLGLAGLLAGVLPFRGHAMPVKERHDPAWPLWIPPLVLAIGGLLAGAAPSVLDNVLAAAATAIAGVSVEASLGIWHGLTPAVLLSVLTLASIGFAYVVHEAVRTRTWTPRHGPEDVYDGVLSALNSASHVIAPALHSASLRTYVMVIVATSVLVGSSALVTAPTVGSVVARTSITAYDVILVFIIIAGAMAAAVARSTMAAVLSLGAVGYGVAMMFVGFGAPDLAMTQFSVETLTVLIYVLVFRHFRTVDALSSRLVRARDALIAVAIGTFIGGLLLSVATTETAPRLREYFAEFGPTLGHGRNIVNVILVDFRAFDTLGEITVLATAAIGVRGLLRLAAHGRVNHEPVRPVTSPIFRTAARLLMPLLLLFSVFLLLRGHNEPGGGFVGGLIAAAAFALYGIAFGVRRARQALLVRPMTLLGAGLLMALLSGVPAVLRGRPFLAAMWTLRPVAVGTPALFDAGVFLVVAGVVLMMIFTLAEES